MEHFQKLIYLLSLFLPVMVFFSLGLWFAWTKWFKHSRAFNESIEEHRDLVEKLNLLYQKQANLSGEWEQLPSNNLVVPEEIIEPDEKINEFEAEAQELREAIEKLKLDHKQDSEELIALKEENAKLNRRLTKIVDETHSSAFSGIESMETILNNFADELVTNDPELGIVFQEKPDYVDDLTQIDILSQHIASKLNKIGIYRYRQIALWSHDQFDKILAKIEINPNQTIGKNGIWQKDAARLHKKYH